jgi:PAS domain S-box-containing protein
MQFPKFSVEQLRSPLPRPREGESERKKIRGYLWVISIVVVAIVVRFLLEPYLQKSGFAIFLLATLIAGWTGGIGPCLLAQTLILAADVVLFRHGRETGDHSLLQAIVGVSLYYLVGILVGSLSDFWHAAKQRAEMRRRELQQQHERLAAILSCLEDAVLVSSPQGQLILMNPAAERLTGFTFSECRDKEIREVLCLTDEFTQEKIENPVDQVLRCGSTMHDATACLLRRKSGRPVAVAFTAAPVLDQEGHTTGVVVALHNETERRRAVQALRAADQRKDEFLATLGHELRNPLAPIRMGLELLKTPNSNPQEQSEVREMMERQCHHMVRLIDDLLDVSRVTRGKLELRKDYVEVSEVVRSALDAVRAVVDEAGHQLSVLLPPKPSPLFADGHRLSQVLANLLNNACKFTPRGGKIELRIEQQALETVFAVTDTGIGIPADQRDYVFEMFAQIKGIASTPASGLGIGLTLAKQLVEMHGGTVSIHSEGINCGSRFEVRIPLSHDGQLTTPSSTNGAINAVPLVKYRLLVVDDNADARKTLTMMLKVLGHDVATAQDGLEAISATIQYQPDAVLMDLGMPRMNGCEAARRIREEPAGREVVLIAITGWGQEDDRRRTKEAGFNHHLIKPVDLQQLQVLLDALPAPRCAPRDELSERDGHSRIDPVADSASSEPTKILEVDAV